MKMAFSCDGDVSWDHTGFLVNSGKKKKNKSDRYVIWDSHSTLKVSSLSCDVGAMVGPSACTVQSYYSDSLAFPLCFSTHYTVIKQ